MSVNEQRVLTEGAQAMGLALSDAQAHSLIRYMDLLQQWGSVYNLTAVRDREDMLRTHLLDCLAVVQPLRAQIKNLPEPRLLDVGAGAGLCAGHGGAVSAHPRTMAVHRGVAAGLLGATRRRRQPGEPGVAPHTGVPT